MKKYIAFLLLLLFILSGCSKVPAETTPSTTVPVTEITPQPAGTLYVAFGAALEIVYDDAGNALTLTGVNETGKLLADAKQDQLNKGCVYTLRSIFRYAITNDLMKDVATVTVRVGTDDPLPSEDFLATIAQDCQYLLDEEVTGIAIYCPTDNQLDEQGNLTYEFAAKLAGAYLDVETAELIGDKTPTDGLYAFSGSTKSCTVDAFTGLVVDTPAES